MFKRLVVGVNLHAAALEQRLLAQIVDTVNMIGMRMCIENGIKPLYTGRDHLLAEIRARIHDDGGDAIGPDPLDKKRAARAPVLRIGRVAISPVTIDARNARGR